jgi:hypothetical protein
MDGSYRKQFATLYTVVLYRYSRTPILTILRRYAHVLKYTNTNNHDKHAGLLSLKNPRSEIRPAASDIVLLTVRDVKQPDVILAGAKLPVSRIRFPLRFRLSTSNLINTANVIAIWKESANQHDLLVQAVVCSESSTTASTTSTCNARFRAQGVAKLIRLQESEVTIRSAVSLPLE